MVFKMNGEIELPTKREIVWEMLSDPAILERMHSRM